MSDWVPMREELDQGERENVRGVDITVYLSPYNFPMAYRGRYDKEIDRFVIEFRYLEEEELEPVGSNDPVIFRMGKKSRRLYKIEIDAKRLKAQKVGLKLGVLTQQVQQRLRDLQQHDKLAQNYKVAENLIAEDEGQQVLKDFVGAA
jgi:hypothetical protein